MKPVAIVGLILIIVGVVSLAYQGFTYTTREKAVDLGPLQITTEKTHTVPLPPILGTLALVGGVLLVIARANRS
jgi:uncharacterized membrane protein HdeD (DUF308 family)